jgi:hypothetical protein
MGTGKDPGQPVIFTLKEPEGTSTGQRLTLFSFMR